MSTKSKKQYQDVEETDPEMTEVSGVEEPIADYGQVVDLISGDTIKLNEFEQIRQEEERKLLEEFGYPEKDKRDLIRVDFRIRPRQLKARRFHLVVLRPKTGAEPDEDRVYILIDIQKPKTKAEDTKKGAEITAEFLRDTPELSSHSGPTARIVSSIGESQAR